MSPLYNFLLSDLPQPSLPNVNPFLGYNLFAPAAHNSNQATYVLRVDQRFSDKDLVYVRLSKATETDLQHTNGSAPVPLDGNANTVASRYPNDSFSADWTHTFSPKLVNDFTVSATYSEDLEGGGGNTTKNWDAQLGLSNPNSPWCKS